MSRHCDFPPAGVIREITFSVENLSRVDGVPLRFVRDWLQERDLHSLDYVFQPQYRFVEDRRGNIIVDYVGRIERMDEVETYVTDRRQPRPKYAVV